jgi:hypothetical protein
MIRHVWLAVRLQTLHRTGVPGLKTDGKVEVHGKKMLNGIVNAW